LLINDALSRQCGIIEVRDQSDIAGSFASLVPSAKAEATGWGCHLSCGYACIVRYHRLGRGSCSRSKVLWRQEGERRVSGPTRTDPTGTYVNVYTASFGEATRAAGAEGRGAKAGLIHRRGTMCRRGTSCRGRRQRSLKQRYELSYVQLLA
jgi:hypothetical protein